MISASYLIATCHLFYTVLFCFSFLPYFPPSDPHLLPIHQFILRPSILSSVPPSLLPPFSLNCLPFFHYPSSHPSILSSFLIPSILYFDLLISFIFCFIIFLIIFFGSFLFFFLFLFALLVLACFLSLFPSNFCFSPIVFAHFPLFPRIGKTNPTPSMSHTVVLEITLYSSKHTAQEVQRLLTSSTDTATHAI